MMYYEVSQIFVVFQEMAVCMKCTKKVKASAAFPFSDCRVPQLSMAGVVADGDRAACPRFDGRKAVVINRRTIPAACAVCRTQASHRQEWSIPARLMRRKAMFRCVFPSWRSSMSRPAAAVACASGQKLLCHRTRSFYERALPVSEVCPGRASFIIIILSLFNKNNRKEGFLYFFKKNHTTFIN